LLKERMKEKNEKLNRASEFMKASEILKHEYFQETFFKKEIKKR